MSGGGSYLRLVRPFGAKLAIDIIETHSQQQTVPVVTTSFRATPTEAR
jgi:hypothetical protein